MLQNDGSRDHFYIMNSKMTILTALLANLFQLPAWWSICLKMTIFDISVFWASIWGITLDINWKFTEKIPRNYRKIFVIVLSRDNGYDKQNKKEITTFSVMLRFHREQNLSLSPFHFRCMFCKANETSGHFLTIW